MDEIKNASHTERVDGEKVNVRCFDRVGFVLLNLAVGTNTPMGGDSGHGGRTLLRLSGLTNWDMTIRLKDENGKEHEYFAPESIELVLGGDDEAQTLVEISETVCEVLTSQIVEKHRSYLRGRD